MHAISIYIHTYTHTHTPHSQVHHAQADDEELRGTDGKMLEIIVQNDRVVCLSPTSESGGPEWTQVVDQCFSKSAGALVDAGALLAGISNSKIAEEILLRMSEASPYRGVIFFDVAACSWRIRARDGQEWSKSASPIPERECFALFDEIRCRGADLKLAHNTLAVVTVGTRMCKDKLMQAAGRMRRLTEGQKLVFAVSSDVVVQIRDMEKEKSGTPEHGNLLRTEHDESGNGAMDTTTVSCTDKEGIFVVQLLQWVVRNTVQATMDGMSMHADKGLVYATSRDCRDFAKLDEVLELDDNYADATVRQPVCDIVQKRVRRFEKKRAEVAMCGAALGLMQRIVHMSMEFGRDFTRETSVFDEECERELEREEEEEEEEERQVACAVCVCIYVYVYTKRERERGREDTMWFCLLCLYVCVRYVCK
jgi:hypothetical protein